LYNILSLYLIILYIVYGLCAIAGESTILAGDGAGMLLCYNINDIESGIDRGMKALSIQFASMHYYHPYI
jgi:hypothetical protein